MPDMKLTITIKFGEGEPRAEARIVDVTPYSTPALPPPRRPFHWPTVWDVVVGSTVFSGIVWWFW